VTVMAAPGEDLVEVRRQCGQYSIAVLCPGPGQACRTSTAAASFDQSAVEHDVKAVAAACVLLQHVDA
jgi:hypothetical protein